MLETLRNAWRIEDLRKKILYTLVILFIYRLGSYIPVAGVNADYIGSAVQQYSLLGFMDIMNGGAMTHFTIFAMGITPYINSSIIMQLLTVAIPKLEEMQKEGEEGRKRIAQYTRYVTVGLGFLQAVGIILGLGPQAVVSTNFFNYLSIGLAMAAGTAFTMWLGERINENGVGNGISLIIFVGIVSRLPSIVSSALMNMFNQPTIGKVAGYLLVLAGVIAIIAAVVFVDQGERRVTVQYAKRMVGRKMYGGQQTHIPLKVNSSGVLPLIFASSFLQFPSILAQFWPNSGFYVWVHRWLGVSSPLFVILQLVLVLFFTYFYSAISFNPVEIAKNLQQSGGFIPGIRPGRPTSDFLQKTTNRIVLFGAIFLAVLATVPTIILVLTHNASPMGATSVLIVVSVALETTRQIEAQMVMRHHHGFLN